MPGGFARVGSTPDTRPRSPCSTADKPPTSGWSVIHTRGAGLPAPGWRQASSATLRQPAEPRRRQSVSGWASYAERCEADSPHPARLQSRLAELSKPDLPILTHCAELLESIDVDATEAMPQGLLDTSIGSAVHSAGQIRDRFARWLAGAQRPAKTAQRLATRIGTGDDATRAMTVTAAQARRLLRPRA